MTVGSQPSPKDRRFPRGALVAVLSAGVVVLVIVGSFVVWRWQLHRAVNARIAAIHASGLPSNWNELSNWLAAVPDSENGALVYISAMDKMTSDGLSNSRFNLPRRGGTISNELRLAIQGNVRTNQETLNLIYSATNFQRFRYPVNFFDAPRIPLTHLSGLSEVVRLLAGDAVVKCDAGDVPAAGRDIDTSFRVARSLDGEPVLLSQLVAGRLLTTSCQSLERVLCRAQLDDATLAEIQNQMTAAEATNRFLLGMVGDRAINAEIIRLAQDNPQEMMDKLTDTEDKEARQKASGNIGPAAKLSGIFERDRIFYLDAMETNIMALKAGPPASLLSTNQIESFERRARSGLYIFSGLLLSGNRVVIVRDASVRADLRTAIAAAAVERWRLAHHGAIPDSLNDLGPSLLPSVPVDPFDGQPLRFKKLQRGYVIYSIGPNQRDDGGLEQLPSTTKASQEERNKYDITFTVER